MEIGDLTAAEVRVWEAFARGETVDLGGDAVRGEVLRELLLGDHRRQGEVAALRVTAARVTGRLDLQYATVDSPVHLWACVFDNVLDLYGAQTRQLSLGESRLPGLHAIGLRVDGTLRMTRCRVTGPVRLAAARIAGAVFLDDARLGDAADPADEPARADESVLQLNRITVEDSLSARRMTVHGKVRLDAAVVGASLNLDDAELHNPGDTALQAPTLSVGSDFNAMRLTAHGRVNLRGVRIPGHLNLGRARLSNPGHMALRLSGAVVGELLLRGAEPIRGEVTLRRSQIDFIYLAPEAAPPTVWLEGLTYTTLAPHEPAERRLPLLEREKHGYVPHAYEQLTAAYRRMGDDAAARTVQLAKQRRHRGTLPAYARAWGHLQDATVGYGFRPVRAAAWLVSLLLIGSVTFGLHEPRALKPDEAPAFNALAYTLDLLLPIIDFGQEKAYTPDGAAQWLAYGLIVTGWVLATAIAAGVTRTISRQ
ncbi:membrane-associated oxidoreductase [Streptomyces monticola]|uniref:Membrane-associated oxidoreductase n=1 Tax=Streptomyces monticola TaxID=2666263 RepID=A0ABW2JLM1_9ACTN